MDQISDEASKLAGQLEGHQAPGQEAGGQVSTSLKKNIHLVFLNRDDDVSLCAKVPGIEDMIVKRLEKVLEHRRKSEKQEFVDESK